MSSNIVVEWLRSLHLGQYSESFIDNGYDDLEICKQVGDPDLDAIGVFNPSHRNRLLQSVRTLREEGAASVYFTLEETTAVHEDCQCDNSSARSSRTSSGHQGSSDKEQQQQQQSQRCTTGNSPASSSADSAQELGKYLDEYEEGKAELVKIPKIQLKLLLKEKLSQDGIRLSCQPYSTSTGERGYVEGLASRYADLFNTHYGDVLEHLEDLRRREWEDLSPRIRVLETPAATSTDAAAATGGTTTPGTPQGHHGITTSHSQPIYVPGKYSPSSCLSDKEEDEIYGFGYGVYGKQMLHRQQQHKMIISPQQQLAYQSCLSPRSAYFYEFPPSEQAGGQQSNKKKTSFSRFLRGLKTGHRKEKHSGSSPRHSRAARVPQQQQQQQQQTAIAAGARVGTPDSVVESMLPSIVDPRDYDRLRFIQMNGGTGNSFEETIHRLKVQEVLKKRERFHKEHEEVSRAMILRDIRQGLMQYGREGIRPAMADDNTYMYDDDPRVAGLGPHWYDEPPYESDPEDFLMGTSAGQALSSATVQNGRVCFTLNLRSEPRGEGVISLRTAGDISIPRDPSTNGAAGVWLNNAHGIAPLSGAGLTPRGSARRGLLLPQSGPYPATIIPLGTGGGPHLRANRGDRESGDYASSDVQSIGSRLSTMSIDTSRSEQLEGPGGMSSPSYLSAHGGKGQSFQKLVGYASRSSASEEGLSASQSSDYEDQEDLDSVQQLTVHSAGESGGRSPGMTLVGRMRGLRQDVQKKISRLRTSGPGVAPQTSGALPERRGETFPSTSSVESLPSGSGSSTQALVPAAGSNHSSLSAEDRDASPINQTASSTASQVIGKARALVDYTPNPYEKDFLKFKKGDIIDVIAMNATGVWRGMVHNRVGNFKFVNVELISDKVLQRVSGISSGTGRQRNSKYGTTGGRCGSRGRPRTVEELLQRMSLEEHISVFVLNGYENLELFKDLEEEDLDYLGITNPEHRAKILTAVELLHDYDSPGSPEETDGEDAVSSSEDEATSQQSECSSVQQQLDAAAKTTFRRLQFPRDSGCYDSKHHHRHHHHHHHHKKSFPQGGTLPHHHHHHHHHKSCRSKDVTESCAGTIMRPQGGMDCMARLHHCSSRDISSNKDSGMVTSLLQQCSGAGHPEGSSELGYTMGTGPKLQVGSANEPADTGKQGHIAAGTGTSQQQQSQQSFHPNIPISSSNPSASPIAHIPSGSDFQGAGGGGRNLIISASTVSSSVSSSSPIRTCATSPFNTDFKSDSYVVARGKLVSVESCRKTGSPSSPIGGMRCTKKQPQQQQVLMDSPRHSPSNPFCTATTNVADMAAATPTSCSGGAVIVEDACETNPKLTMVKYVVGGSSDLGLGCESGNVMGRGGGGCCLSEKSSDSGVSSSSLSSANPREGCSKREGRGGLSGQSVVESPTKGFIGFGNCLNNGHGSSPTGNNSKNLILQGPEKTSYQ